MIVNKAKREVVFFFWFSVAMGFSSVVLEVGEEGGEVG